jgi:hypothetical protein
VAGTVNHYVPVAVADSYYTRCDAVETVELFDIVLALLDSIQHLAVEAGIDLKSCVMLLLNFHGKNAAKVETVAACDNAKPGFDLSNLVFAVHGDAHKLA